MGAFKNYYIEIEIEYLIGLKLKFSIHDQKLFYQDDQQLLIKNRIFTSLFSFINHQRNELDLEPTNTNANDFSIDVFVFWVLQYFPFFF